MLRRGNLAHRNGRTMTSAHGGHPAITSDTLSLESDALRITLNATTGSVVQIENRLAKLNAVQHPVLDVPWRIELDEAGTSRWIEDFTSFRHKRAEDATALNLTWETSLELVVEASVVLPDDGVSAEFTVAVHGAPDVTVDKIEYPIMTGIGHLTASEDSVLVHPHGTGFLFRRPCDLFATEGRAERGLRYSPYPEGFNGSSMQFMTYYAEGTGGFYLATHDPGGSMKWLNFYKETDGALASTFMHQSPDMAPGRGYTVPYPIIIGTLVEGTWYEAAERYKAWASQQPWTAQGTLADRSDLSPWLLDDVGMATFGMNASADRSRWLDRFHHMVDGPVFHVLGVNWPKTVTGYGREHPGGHDDWFPATFSPENLETIRQNGDYWAPFEFDLLMDLNKSDSEELTANLLQLPEQKYSLDKYRFRFQCPATDYLPALHRWRDTELAGTYGVDALYYDISANNVLMTCRNPDHGHPVGGGGWMVEAYATMWKETGRAASDAKGTHVAQGAEMVNEVFIPELDYYQARAEASPLSGFEADRFKHWIVAGHAEKIPLFAFVYHEYGPVRLDGWGKLSVETGELFYWVGSRVLLWGGIFELNYEFSDLEALEGFEDHPHEHYAAFERRAYAIDPSRVDFVRDLATARTGFANRYLAYGTMLRPLEFETPRIELDYFHYNVAQTHQHYEDRGSMHVPSIVHAAWRSPEGNPGFLFVNLHAQQIETLPLEIDLTAYGIDPDTVVTIQRRTAQADDLLGTASGHVSIELVLAPRQVTLVEVIQPQIMSE